MEIPPYWRFENDCGSTCDNIRWWESFGDPVLNALIMKALQNNNDLKTAMWRVFEYYGRFQALSSKRFPQIDLDGFAQKQRYPVQAGFLPPGFDPITPHYKYEFTLNWELDFWGKVYNQTKSAFDELLAQVQNRRSVVLTLVSSVASSYIRLRELDRELEIAQATVRDREEYLDLARKRFLGGLTSEIEVEQAIAVLQETKGVVTQLEARIPIEEDLLSVLLGESPTCIMRGREVYDFCMPPCIPADVPSLLIERRPDIISSELELMAANARIGVARAAFFPKISLTGEFGGESFQLNQLFSLPARMWEIGASYVEQIFTGWRLTGELNEAIGIKQELLYQYQQTILTAFREVSDALIAHKQSKELVEVKKAQVEADATYLKLAFLRYYNGQNDYLTVLDAEEKLFNAQIELTQAQGDVFLTLVQLYKSLGGGWILDADRIGLYYE